MHTHTPYATALGCLQDPALLMMHQNSCRFKDRCAWDTGYQPATEILEGERLGQVLGDKDILFMCHHGTLVVADTVHAAFDEVILPSSAPTSTSTLVETCLNLVLFNHLPTIQNSSRITRSPSLIHLDASVNI